MNIGFFEDVLLDLGLAVSFAFVALMLLWEYRRLFDADSRSAFSIGMLRRSIRSSGVMGYFAVLLLAASVVCLCAGLITLLLNIAPLLNLLE